MVSDFSPFFLKRVQLILSKAFSLRVIYPVRTNSNVMWLPFGKRIAFSGHGLKGWPRAACSVCGGSEKMPAQRAQMCHKSMLPDFNSPVLTGKQKLRQPQPRTHIYTEKTRQCWDVQLALLDYPGVRHLCTIPSSFPVPSPRPSSPWLHSVQHWCYWKPTAATAAAQRNADFSTD